MQYLKNLLQAQVEMHSSDLHLYVGHRPYLRGPNGDLYPVEQYEAITDEDMKNILKHILSDAQIKKFEEEKELEFSVVLEDISRFRINFYYERRGICAVFRMIEWDIRTPEELGLPEAVYDLAKFRYGMVLVAGPNGSGKSTSMASIIEVINKEKHYNIVTIEDPVEILYESKKCVISQREIGRDIKDFENAAKHLFRQDVNIVVIGEMRDYETFASALDIAETGHLVFATVHTEDVKSTISRIINIFPSEKQNQIRTQLSFALKGVLCQKLIPKKDLSGRVVATEIMFNNDAVANSIRRNGLDKMINILETNLNRGMRTFDYSLKELYEKGLISRGQALIHAHDSAQLAQVIPPEKEKKQKKHLKNKI